MITVASHRNIGPEVEHVPTTPSSTGRRLQQFKEGHPQMRPALREGPRQVRNPQAIPFSSLGTEAQADASPLGIPETFRESRLADLSGVTLETKAQ